MEKSAKKNNLYQLRVCKEFNDMMEKVKKYMQKFSYGILDVTNKDASKLLWMKMEKYGGIEKFLKYHRLELE